MLSEIIAKFCCLHWEWLGRQKETLTPTIVYVTQPLLEELPLPIAYPNIKTRNYLMSIISYYLLHGTLGSVTDLTMTNIHRFSGGIKSTLRAEDLISSATWKFAGHVTIDLRKKQVANVGQLGLVFVYGLSPHPWVLGQFSKREVEHALGAQACCLVTGSDRLLWYEIFNIVVYGIRLLAVMPAPLVLHSAYSRQSQN